MKNLYIVANWKENKSLRETNEWINAFVISDIDLTNKQVIVCPPFTLLGFLKSKIVEKNLPVKIGAQDISRLEEGSYTGEISARQAKDYADFVIIGHSERRTNFGEDEGVISEKLEMANKAGLNSILCVSSLDQISNQKSFILNSGGDITIAYEPLSAIGSGNPDTPKNADDMAKKIKEELGSIKVLYGGSVSFENVNSFTLMPNIDGVLVGHESLDPLEFSKIVKNA